MSDTVTNTNTKNQIEQERLSNASTSSVEESSVLPEEQTPQEETTTEEGNQPIVQETEQPAEETEQPIQETEQPVEETQQPIQETEQPGEQNIITGVEERTDNINNINRNIADLNKELSNLNNLDINEVEENDEMEGQGKNDKNQSPLHRILDLEMGERRKKTALIIVNVQNCFFRGGAMAMYPDDDIKEDVAKEKEFIRRINQLIALFEEDKDYFNASLAGSPIYTEHMLKIIDPNSELELYDGTYPTGTRKKYYFDHVVYTQTAYPPDHKSFASHHYLREKKNKINNLMKVKDLSLEEAIERLPEDALDLHYWAYVNSTFENQGMLQFDKRTEEKLWADHALIDGSDTIIENETCYRGVEFHPRLNLGPLYRPNPSINPQVYINQPNVDGRGRVVWLEGDHKSTPRSAFMNNIKEQTGLTNYLTNNKVEKVFIVGMFRDLMVEATAIDAVSAGFDDVNIIYDATLPFGIPLNKTDANNKFFFKDKAEIVSFLERIESSDDERNYYDFLKENNKWCLNLERKNIKIINSSNIFDSITVGKEEFGCGFNPEGLIKNFDLLLKTSTYTSRKKNATIV